MARIVFDINNSDYKTLLEMSCCQLSSKKTSEIVVRGAIIQCAAGSHYRYLNVPINRGIATMSEPVVLQSDCVSGINIPDFGICALKTITAASKNDFLHAESMPGTIKKGALTYGIPCAFRPIGKWSNVDERSLSMNYQTLQMEGEVLTSSKLMCEEGELVDPMIFSGQGWFSFLADDSDYLSDHSYCKFNNKATDPIQIIISKNTITINAYVKYKNADKKRKKLIQKAIKQWEGDYKYVFGHKVKVKMEIKEVDLDNVEQKCTIFECKLKEECQAIENNIEEIEKDQNGELKISHMQELISEYDYGKDRTLLIYPIEAKKRYNSLGAAVLEDGKHATDVRELTDTEYKAIVPHEFAHSMGLSDAYNEILESNDLRKKDESGSSAMEGNDIMLKSNYASQMTISPINIQMIIVACYERKMQFYNTYSDRTKSIGADKNEMFEKCENKKENK